MTSSEVHKIISYLGRIIPRGQQEEQEIIRLLNSLHNLTIRRKEKEAA